MPTASPDSFSDHASQTLTEHLPEAARRQLDALRAALEVRLSRLEAVLADPGYGESLEALILDLARVATQEARATATLACVDTKRDADTELARVRATVQAALDAERATVAELRRSVEQAGERIAALQRDQQTETAALRQQFDASLARERALAAEFERDVKSTRQQLDAERSVIAQLRQTAGQVPELSAALERETKRADSMQNELSIAMARSRDAAETTERARADLQAELQSERASVAALQQDVKRAEEQRAAVEHERAEREQRQEELTREVTDLREALADRDRAHAGLQADLDAALASSEQLRREIERDKELSTAFDHEKAQALALHKELTTELARARDLAGENERAWVDAQTQLDAERAAMAALGQELERFKSERFVLEREKTDAERSLQEMTTELADERRAAAVQEHARTGLQAELDGERASHVASRQEIERIQALLTTNEREKAKAQRLYHELTSTVAAAQQAASDNERARQDLQSRLESEQAAIAELRQELERDKALSAAFDKEKTKTIASQKELGAELKRMRKAAADSERTRDQLQSQLEAERTAGARVREELEAQKARVESQAQEHAKVLAARQELTAGLARANEAAAEHQRVRDEAQSVLDAERAVVAGLRQQIEREAAQAERIEEERRKAVAKHEELAAELAQIRELAAASDRALAELQATLDAERASHAASREASKRDRAEVTSADRDKTKALQDMSADLTRAREDAAASDRLRAETQSTLDAQRASNTELHQELERAQAVAASLEIEKAEAERLHRDVAAELSLAREAARLADLAAAEPLSAVASPPDVEPRGKAAVSAPLVPPLPPGAIDSSWQGVRSANRFSFREPLVVQINGEPGLLFDLSIAGCQVQSTSRLKPNHGIRVILPRDAKAFTCHGKVVWARLELPAAGRPLGYRAGVQFTKPDEAAIEAFLARHFT